MIYRKEGAGGEKAGRGKRKGKGGGEGVNKTTLHLRNLNSAGGTGETQGGRQSRYQGRLECQQGATREPLKPHSTCRGYVVMVEEQILN